MNKKKALLVGGLAVGAAVLLFSMGGAEAHAARPEPDVDDDDDEPTGMPAPITGEVPDGQDAHELEDVADEVGDVLEGLPEVRIPAPVVKPAPVTPPKLPPPQVIVDEVIKNLPIERGPVPKVTVPKVEAPTVEMPAILPEPGEVVTAPEPAPMAPDTLAMVRALLAKERTANWKSLQEPLVAAWQRSRGLPEDGKFGPGSALHLAEETGLLPIVRAWPKGTWPEKAVPDYRGKVLALANVAESPRREHLMAAAEREQGQAFGTPPKPVVVHITGV